MPTNIVDVSTFTSPVPVPAGGDLRTAASVQVSFQALANRTKWLQDNAIPLSGTKALTGPLTLTGHPVTFGAGAVVAGGMTVANVTATGHIQAVTATFDGIVDFTGAGRIRRRRVVVADANTTYGINNGDFFIASGITADRIYMLSSAGALSPDIIEFVNLGAFKCTVDLDTTAGGLTYDIGGNPTRPSSMRFFFDGGWWPLSWGWAT